MKEKKSKRINLSVTEEEYQEIIKSSNEIGESASSYCVRAIKQSLGKVEKIEPKNINIEIGLIDIYRDDISEGFNKFGDLASKISRLIHTLENRETVSDFEVERLAALVDELNAKEDEFINVLLKVLEERKAVRNTVSKKIDKKIDEFLRG